MRQRSMLGRAAPLNIEPVCEHEWKRYKQTLSPQERTTEQINMGLEWKGLNAYFILNKCEKCQKKLYTDYKVER